MRVDAHEVGLDQDVGRGRGVGRGEAEPLEDAGHVPAQPLFGDQDAVVLGEG